MSVYSSRPEKSWFPVRFYIPIHKTTKKLPVYSNDYHCFSQVRKVMKFIQRNLQVHACMRIKKRLTYNFWLWHYFGVGWYGLISILVIWIHMSATFQISLEKLWLLKIGICQLRDTLALDSGMVCEILGDSTSRFCPFFFRISADITVGTVSSVSPVETGETVLCTFFGRYSFTSV